MYQIFTLGIMHTHSMLPVELKCMTVTLLGFYLVVISTCFFQIIQLSPYFLIFCSYMYLASVNSFPPEVCCRVYNSAQDFFFFFLHGFPCGLILKKKKKKEKKISRNIEFGFIFKEIALENFGSTLYTF